MRIIQMSDFHLRADGKLSFFKVDTEHQVNSLIQHMLGLQEYELPEFFVISGDVSEGADIDGYRLVKKNLDKLPRPAYVLPGNHDERDLMLEIFDKELPVKDDIRPYLCYTIENPDLRTIVVDTAEEGKHWGGLSDRVAEWLDAEIKKDLKTPTIVFSHHPPFKTGLPAMDEGFANADRYAEILGQHPNLVLRLGHLHTPVFTTWRGIQCAVCPSTSMQMEVDFREKDGPYVSEAEAADDFKGGGDRFFVANPAYMIHNLVDDRINTHIVPVNSGADYSGPFVFKYYEGEH